MELVLTRPAPSAPRCPRTRSPEPQEPPSPQDTAVADTLAKTASALALAAVEILNGQRSSRTVSRWFTPELLENMRVSAGIRATLARSRPPQPAAFTAGRARICQVTSDIAEASVVIHSPRRSRAVSLRMEQHRGRWIVTQLLTL